MWPVHAVPVWKMLAVMLVGMTLLPVPVSMDVRGWQEMHPLNGPGWSLFYEYVRQYTLCPRRAAFSEMAAGGAGGRVGCGADPLRPDEPLGRHHRRLVAAHGRTTGRRLHTHDVSLLRGIACLSRLVRPGHVRRAFWWCSLGLVALLAVPRVGGTEHLWQNGLYDALVVVVLFPLIVWTGASGTVTGRSARMSASFWADISYPIYITHYPLVYTYTAWVRNHGLTLGEAWPAAAGTVVVSVLLAYAALKWYDEPVRRWLRRKFMQAPPLFGFPPSPFSRIRAMRRSSASFCGMLRSTTVPPLVEGDAVRGRRPRSRSRRRPSRRGR